MKKLMKTISIQLMRKLKNSYFITRGDNINGINYDKFKSPNSFVSQLELIGYIGVSPADGLNNNAKEY